MNTSIMTTPELTTTQLQAMLGEKYPRDRYALFFDVPDNVGTNAHRRADAIAVGCWRSVGHLIDGFELKVSRSDWLRELASVTKADPFLERCDRWWLVTSSPTIAKLEELPACWGWMAVTKGGLRVQKPAPRLPQPDSDRVHRLFMIGILRKLQDDLTRGPEVAAIMQAAHEKREEEIEQRVKSRTEYDQRRVLQLQATLKKFEEKSGLKVEDWRLGNVAELVKAVDQMKSFGGAYWDQVAQTLLQQERSLSKLLEEVHQARAQIGEQLQQLQPLERQS
jgi:hypothetical protein